MEHKSRPIVDISAACACGAVTVTWRGKVRSMFLCSCEDCQQATGTGHSAIAIAAQADVTISGETRSFSRQANSGAHLTRHFCPVCGTPIYGQSSRADSLLMLPVGLFGAAAAQWFAPNQLIFARSHRAWDIVAPELPQHQTYREGGALA
ncbi:MAG: GFA family protein [Devosia sp.]